MIEIAGRKIGLGQKTFIVAELSANARTFDEAMELIRQAKHAGADAIKTQAYKPESMTIACDNEHFQIKAGPWVGYTLWQLYRWAAMPREWHKGLKQYAESLGIGYFATAFCCDDVDFLEELGVPCHKVASFEIRDMPLIRYMASKGKPMIISTGMATVDDVQDAVDAAFMAGDKNIVLLQCTSGYPSPVAESRLKNIALLKQFNIRRKALLRPKIGLSDHTLSIVPPVVAVTLGACVIEKHLTLSRDNGSRDASFSLEPREFKAMVEAVRDCEAALGSIRFGPTESEKPQMPFRRSLFVVEAMRDGDVFSLDNVRSIRPAAGLPPCELDNVLGKRASRDIERGTPLAWELIRE